MTERKPEKTPPKRTGVSYALLALRLVVGGVFAYAASKKLLAPVEEFEAAIRTYEVLSNGALVHLTAVALPWVELIAGVLLIFGAFLRWTLIAHGVLLLVFIVLISQGMIRGLDIDCGCFGQGPSTPIDTLVRDFVLLAAVVIQLKWLPQRWSVDAWFKTG